MTRTLGRVGRIESPDAYAKSTVLTDATSLQNFVRSLCENYPVSDDVHFIDYLLSLVVLAAKGGDIPEKKLN